jgi:hypothetical protein
MKNQGEGYGLPLTLMKEKKEIKPKGEKKIVHVQSKPVHKKRPKQGN